MRLPRAVIRALMIAGLTMAPAIAFAQGAVKQAGPVVPGALAQWGSNGVVLNLSIGSSLQNSGGTLGLAPFDPVPHEFLNGISGGAFTTAQPSASDLTNGTTGSGAVVLQSGGTLLPGTVLPGATATLPGAMGSVDISAQPYGAVADNGVTDNSAAVQAAADTGRDLYFPNLGSSFGICEITIDGTQQIFGGGLFTAPTGKTCRWLIRVAGSGIVGNGAGSINGIVDKNTSQATISTAAAIVAAPAQQNYITVGPLSAGPAFTADSVTGHQRICVRMDNGMRQCSWLVSVDAVTSPSAGFKLTMSYPLRYPAAIGAPVWATFGDINIYCGATQYSVNNVRFNPQVWYPATIGCNDETQGNANRGSWVGISAQSVKLGTLAFGPGTQGTEVSNLFSGGANSTSVSMTGDGVTTSFALYPDGGVSTESTNSERVAEYAGTNVTVKVNGVTQTRGTAGVIPPGVATVSSGTYDTGTGAVVLTLAASTTLASGDSVTLSSMTGTGSISSLNGTWTATSATSGKTLAFTGPTGLTLTITGGSVAFSRYIISVNGKSVIFSSPPADQAPITVTWGLLPAERLAIDTTGAGHRASGFHLNTIDVGNADIVCLFNGDPSNEDLNSAAANFHCGPGAYASFWANQLGQLSVSGSNSWQGSPADIMLKKSTIIGNVTDTLAAGSNFTDGNPSLGLVASADSQYTGTIFGNGTTSLQYDRLTLVQPFNGNNPTFAYGACNTTADTPVGSDTIVCTTHTGEMAIGEQNVSTGTPPAPVTAGMSPEGMIRWMSSPAPCTDPCTIKLTSPTTALIASGASIPMVTPYSVPSRPLDQPGFRLDKYYSPEYKTTSQAGTAPGANLISCSLGRAGNSGKFTLNALAAYLSTTDPAGHIQFAVYNNSPQGVSGSLGRPSTLVVASGSVATSAAETLATGVSTQVPGGALYWWCENTDSATAAPQALAGNLSAYLGGDSITSAATGAVNGIHEDSGTTFGTWPTSFDSTKVWDRNTTAISPWVMFRPHSQP